MNYACMQFSLTTVYSRIAVVLVKLNSNVHQHCANVHCCMYSVYPKYTWCILHLLPVHCRLHVVFDFNVILLYNNLVTGICCTLQRNDNSYHYHDSYYDYYTYGSGEDYDDGSGPEDPNEVGSSGIISYSGSTEFLFIFFCGCLYASATQLQFLCVPRP